MAVIEQNGTRLSFVVHPFGRLSKGEFVKIEVAAKNSFVSYEYLYKDIAREDLENWIFSMFRLLAGGYAKETTIFFENAKISIELYPYTNDGEEVSREERRKQDCAMSIGFLMRDKTQFFGGVYSFVLHKQEIERFANELWEEYKVAFARIEKKRGKYLFVGVSPQGYKGCNYWYLDNEKKTLAGDYVWVYMGRHNTKQIVYVDSVRYYGEDDTPIAPNEMRTIVRKATDKEVEEWKRSLNKE